MKRIKVKGKYKRRYNGRTKKEILFIFKKVFEVDAVEITHRSIDIDVEKEINAILKRRGYVDKLEGWYKGFVRVIVDKKSVKITHDIPNNKMSIVSNPLLTLDDWCEYFERINSKVQVD